jgi:hypothetical protein
MRALLAATLLAAAAAAVARAQSLEQAAYESSERFDGSGARGDADELKDAVSGVAAPAAPASRPLSKDDAALLDDVERRAFRFFWEQADPQTGLAPDRAANDGGAPRQEKSTGVASVASTGFELSALCVGVERGWAAREKALERARATLSFLLDKAPQEHGFYYHFIDMKTGARMWGSEVSTIDTALLLGGVLTARQCFGDDPQVKALATSIYERVDFPWMLKGKPPLLSMGWTPEKGFIPARWDTYSEHMILDLLAVGSPTHPIPASTWDNWKRTNVSYGGYSYVAGDTPLFIHQYSQAYVDFRGLKDGHGIDYFQNSVDATLAQRRFFADLGKTVPPYSENVWGGTASDTERGYKAWGGPPRGDVDDGTLAPCAPAGSLMFTPEESLAALREMKKRWGKAYGRYGFADAFNPATGWTDSDVIGIDQGISLLSAENARGGGIWRWFMRNEEIGRAMGAVGFKQEKP